MSGWDSFDTLSPEAQVHWDRDLGWRVTEMELRTNITWTPTSHPESRCSWTACAWVPYYGACVPGNPEGTLGYCFLYFEGHGWVDRVYYLVVTRMTEGLRRMKTPRLPGEWESALERWT